MGSITYKKCCHSEMKQASLYLMLSIVFLCCYVFLSVYLIWLFHDSSILYTQMIQEQKQHILNACTALSEQSCPFTHETDVSMFSTKAIEWRNTCKKKISDSNIEALSDSLETRSIYLAVESMKRTDTWKSSLPSDQLSTCENWDSISRWMNPSCYIHWLLSNHIDLFWQVLIILFSIIGINIFLFSPLRLAIRWQEKWEIQQKAKKELEIKQHLTSDMEDVTGIQVARKSFNLTTIRPRTLHTHSP